MNIDKKYTSDYLNNIDFIILVGAKNVGKDTCADYISNKIGWKTYALAKPLKDICKIAFNLSDQQVTDCVLKETPLTEFDGATPRKIMQIMYVNLFTEALSDFFPKDAPLFFVKHMEKTLETDKKSAKVIITDMRNPKYCSYLQNKYNTITIKITRSSNEKIADYHISETDVENIKKWDLLIENNTTIPELYKKIDSLFE